MRIVFDMDGTLADNGHRQELARIAAGAPMGEGKNEAWERFHAGIPDDKPIYPILETLNAFADYWAGYSIEIWTARPERFRDVTLAWCEKYDVRFDVLRMRPNNDWRKSQDLKMSWHAETPADLVFEDHPEVVRLMRAAGVVVAQVGEQA